MASSTASSWKLKTPPRTAFSSSSVASCRSTQTFASLPGESQAGSMRSTCLVCPSRCTKIRVIGSLRVLRPLRGQRRLCGGEPGHRHAIGRAAHVIEADVLEEVDRRRVAAVFAADAELDARAGGAALGDRDGNELPDAGRV